ncbi:uncharacterized protein BX664DRAFT_342901 [Halteromyces radiatus]|uniref:uncharacterized protein n=1 Tax=Halteromyces radiatus TaxID=101107 RepID=UPI0022208D33|nr:uncharacterized protein BX664DRAFT_342901 [Halteromyces radiatus]KAI8078860.1 hypothetical protein BX664DRAFT_342901 [Halteromyces radiatus]
MPDIDNFRRSTSVFREYEERCLHINIHRTNDMSLVFKPNNDGTLLTTLQDLVLDTYDASNILVFVPTREDGLNSTQRRFLNKLKLVLLNNSPEISEPSDGERFIDDLVSFLCIQANLDEGLELSMRPCLLRLIIGEETFTANTNKEGRRRGRELIWLLQEDKHRNSTTYKHGDLQLACSMIAAIQRNYIHYDTIKPRKLLGMKIAADKFYFYSMEATEEYINELFGGLPQQQQHIVIHRYPENGLSLADPTERKEILKYLSLLYREALSMD